MATNSDLAPEFSGRCALAAHLKKNATDLPAGKPDIHAIVDGKLYLFSNSLARSLWLLLAAPEGKWKRWLILVLVVAVAIWIGSFVLS